MRNVTVPGAGHQGSIYNHPSVGLELARLLEKDIAEQVRRGIREAMEAVGGHGSRQNFRLDGGECG